MNLSKTSPNALHFLSCPAMQNLNSFCESFSRKYINRVLGSWAAAFIFACNCTFSWYDATKFHDEAYLFWYTSRQDWKFAQTGGRYCPDIYKYRSSRSPSISQGIQAFIGVGGDWLSDVSKVDTSSLLFLLVSTMTISSVHRIDQQENVSPSFFLSFFLS